MNGIKIVATGRYLPQRAVSNDDFSQIVETSDEWISQRTGMKNRYLSSGEPTWLMGALAADNALKTGGIDAAQIDLILVTTVTADYVTPSIACLIQAHLGAENAACMDINAACSGFVYALDMARRYLCFDDVSTVLVVSCETLSKITDYTDRASCVLFGDASGAAVVQAADSRYSSELSADGRSAQLLYCKSPFVVNNPFMKPELVPEYKVIIHPETDFLFMDGREVYKFAIKAMPKVILAACEKAGITVADIDLIIPHQANIRIVETAAKALGVPMSKMFVNLEKYGNTSSACIPMCIDELNKSGQLKAGQTIAVVGFGAGVTCAAVIFQW